MDKVVMSSIIQQAFYRANPLYFPTAGGDRLGGIHLEYTMLVITGNNLFGETGEDVLRPDFDKGPNIPCHQFVHYLEPAYR